MERRVNKVARVAWIDNLRGLACLLVLLIHSSLPVELNRFISPFFLTIFFMLSGYLFKDRPIVEQFKNIINRLLIPYVIAALTCFIVVRWVKEGLVFDIHFLNGIIGTVIFGKSLWFIPCLIVVEVLYTLIRETKINNYMATCLSVVSILLTNNMLIGGGKWCLTQALFCLSYFILGHILQKSTIIDKISKSTAVLGCIIYLIAYFVWAKMFGGIGVATMYNNHYENPIQFIILSYSSIMLIFVSFRHFFNHHSRVMDLFGRNSLWIFAIQSMIMSLIADGALRNSDNPWRCIPIFLLLAIPSVIISEVLRRYLPHVTGKHNYIK